MKPARKLKKSDTSSKLILEEVIGLTVKNANGLASSISKSKCAYTAGCVVVVHNVDSGTQSHLMVSNRMPKPLSCVAISEDGSLIAAGESGHQPAVLVWDSAALTFVCELKGHQYGVTCIAFSPDGKQVVSVGYPHDGYICLWDWRSGKLLTKVKACSSWSAVSSVNFSSDANFVVTAGEKHLKFWKIGSSIRPRTNAGVGSLLMHGKHVNLGRKKGYSFIAIASPNRTGSSLGGCDQAVPILPVYALTNAGVLCILDSGWSVRSSVDLKVEKCFALSASNKLIACACNNGVVKLFTVDPLKYAGRLQYSDAKNCNDANDVNCHTKIRAKDCHPSLPDAIACQFISSEKLVIVYGDHSLYIWDIHDVHKATRCCVLVSHSACIWDIKNLLCENMHDPYLACVARGCSGGVSFATCSADGTIRLWDLSLQPLSSANCLTPAKNHRFPINEPVGNMCLVSGRIFERDSVESCASAQGFRAMAVSSDGKHLAAGDCKGNLHIYNLHTSVYKCFEDAHDAEILALSFSLPSKKDLYFEKETESHCFIASGGRDRMIHLYDVNRNFSLLGSVDDHSAAVTSVKLTCDGSKILSSSEDRSLVVRDVVVTDTDCKISRSHNQIASHGTVYDMTVDPLVEIAVTVGQDKKINTFNIASGTLLKSFKQDEHFGDPIKVSMDPSCSYLVCSYSNRSICMYDFITGERVARAMGHGDVITGVVFLQDCEHIVSVDGDGCIFVWKVPAPLSKRMMKRLEESYVPLSPTSMALPVALRQIKFQEEYDHHCKTNTKDRRVLESSNQVSQKLLFQRGDSRETSEFRFSISRLPKWAQAKVTSSQIIPSDPDFTASQKIFSPLVGNSGKDVPMSPDVQTPSKHDMEGSDHFHGGMSTSSTGTDDSQGSSMPQKIGSFKMDKRWLTIHTVCLDFLNSPEVWDMDIKFPVSNPNLSQDTAVDIRSHVQRIGATTQDPSNASVCHGLVVQEVTKQLQSDKTESGERAAMDVNASIMKSLDKDLFDKNSGNLSSKLKMNGKNAFGQRSHSARFVVRRDLVRDQMRLFDTPVRYLRGETINQVKEITPFLALEDPILRELEGGEACKQDLKDSTQNMLHQSQILPESDSNESSDKDNSGTSEVINSIESKECNFGETEKQQIIVAAKEALLNLDAAAESALHIFSTLQSMASPEEISSGPQARLHDEVIGMLPSIMKKVNAVAKLVQSTNNGSGGEIRADASSFEPLLGTLAENLSQRVIELLKKNCSSL